MAQLTWAWTDRHLAAAPALAAAAVGGIVATVEGSHLATAAVGIALVVTVVLTLFSDEFAGIVLGLAAAAGVILVKRVGGLWTREEFAVSLLTTLDLVLVGWLTGRLAARLRTQPGEAVAMAGFRPAFGSLGLLAEGAALDRIEEEMARSRRYRRPLSILVLRTVSDSSASPTVRDGAERTVARLLETLLPETDIPFALASDELGAILPETDVEAGWDLLGPVLDAASGASFADRETGQRQTVADCVELHAGLVAFGDEGSASDLLRTARLSALAEESRASDALLAPGSLERM